MAQRPLQLLAAVVLVTATLGVSTALIEEVREQVLEASPREPEYEFEPSDDRKRGLPIRAFTLLDPAPADLPRRTTEDHTIRLLGDGVLELDTGDRIQVAPFPVPGGADAIFPSGATVDGSTVTCPAGCRIEAVNRAFQLTPNATLSLPSGTQLPVDGDVEPGRRLPLPAGTMVELDPMTMPGPTPLPMIPGTRITIPSAAPAPPSGVTTDRVELPAGTHVQGPANRSAVRDATNLTTPRQVIGTEDANVTKAGKPEVAITDWPEVLRKGRPFQVGGTVTLPNGTPSTGHPITLYANATKQRPGFEIQVGTVTTDDEGRFSATARIPEDRATRAYHLVAEAHALPDRDPPLTAGYSDPVIPVEGEAQLSLEVPTQEGVQVPLPVRVRLTDSYGAPIPNQTVTLQLEGDSWIGTGRTDEQGRATVVATDGLPSPGDWRVVATFDGTEHISSARATASIEGVTTRIVTPPTMVVPRGDHTNLTGRVLHDDGPAAGQEVQGIMGSITTSAVTSNNGSFTLPLDIPERFPLGNVSLELETTEIRATRTVIVTVTGQAQLHVDPPAAMPRGGTLPLAVKATAGANETLTGLPILAQLPDDRVRRAVTGPHGIAILPIPLDRSPLPVRLSTPGNAVVAPTMTTVDLQPGPLGISGDLTATHEDAYPATLRLTAGGPLAGEPFRLTGPGIDVRDRTDAEGTARLDLTVPSHVDPGRHEARLDLPQYNILQTVPLTVLDAPTLEVAIPADGDAGGPVTVLVETTGHKGPLASVPLTVTAEGAFDARTTTTTGADGTATVELEPPDGAEGAVTLTVHAQRTSTTAAATTQTTAQVTAEPFPWWTLLGLIPVLGAGLVYARYRRRGSAPPVEHDTGPTIRMQLAKQGPGMGPVWHPDDPATLVVRLVDEDGTSLGDRSLELTGPRGERFAETDEDGQLRLRLPGHEDGTHVYTARFPGDVDHAATEATLELRIVDYREEIDREYQDLRRHAARAGLCGPDATPHELAKALGGSTAATRLARLFERCDYSPRPVKRVHYERFMKAKEACRPDDRRERA